MIRPVLLAAGVAIIAVVAGAGYWLWSGIHEIENHSMIDEVTVEPAPVEVRPGQSFAAVANQLVQRELVTDSTRLRLHARWHGYADRVQPGEYALEPGLTAAELVRRMARGQVIQYQFTIIEGWNFSTLREQLGLHPAVTPTLPADATDSEIMAAIDRDEVAAEGRFLPETYQFPRGTRDIDILRRANRALERELTRAWEQRVGQLPLDEPDEALILASIIEKETAAPEERRRIAGVFVRRLEQGMRLQTDPTVIYGLGDRFDGRLRTRDLREDTPFNTYTRHGLPPTPIAMAGRASIHAAVDPLPGDALFFVSRGDGTHHFSATYDEHRQAVRRYQLGLDEP